MSTLKIELDTKDAITCAALSTALDTIARGTVTATVESTVEPVVSAPVEPVESASVEVNGGPFYWVHREHEALGTCDTESELESMMTQGCDVIDEEAYDSLREQFSKDDEVEQSDDELDSAGLPWDKRIHSRTQSKNADGTFKVMRKPQSFETKEAWDDYVKAVRHEYIVGTSVIPPAPSGVVEGVQPETVPPAPETVAAQVPPAPESLFADSTPVPPAPETVPPAPETVPPAPETVAAQVPPAPETVPPAPETGHFEGMNFGGLMQMITQNKVDMTKVAEILTSHNISKLPLLAQRTDLIPTIAEGVQSIIDAR